MVLLLLRRAMTIRITKAADRKYGNILSARPDGRKYKICTTRRHRFMLIPGMGKIEVRAMDGYGQYCPLAKGAEVFAERWTPLILRELLRGSTTFNDLHRGVPTMSRTLLSSRLRKLAACGVLERRLRRGGAHYDLTPAGRELGPVVTQL